MSSDESGFITFLILVAILVAFGYGVGYYSGQRYGYISACKDYYTGDLKYELKEVPGGERIWVKKETIKKCLIRTEKSKKWK